MSPPPRVDPRVQFGCRAADGIGGVGRDLHLQARGDFALRAVLDKGLQGVDLKTTETRVGQLTAAMTSLMTGSELSGPVYEDLIHLKSMYSRYLNYAQWLKQQSR